MPVKQEDHTGGGGEGGGVKRSSGTESQKCR